MNNHLYRNKDWLYEMYWDNELSTSEIGIICDTSDSVPRHWMKKFGIPIRTKGDANKMWHEHHPGSWAGRQSPAWKGGRRRSGGYIGVWMPNHPHADRKKYVREHRLVMEKRLGRYLKKEEHVHHIDGNRENNIDSNLFLTNNKEHERKYIDGYKTGFAAAFLLFATINRKES